MGKYTDGLFRHNRRKPNPSRAMRAPVNSREQTSSVKDKYDGMEHLVECAIERDGVISHGFQSHAELRRSLGDEDPYAKNPVGLHGFWTSEGRFVTRREGNRIASNAGQCPIMQRDMLSSDIDW